MFLQLFVELLHVFLCGSVFSILQFLGNFLRSFLHEKSSSIRIGHTNLFSPVEPDLPTDWLDATVIFEIQAHAVTQLMHVLNFSVPNL